ncbi:DNA-binding protein [Caproicibacter fermentans]|uniref:DNA-binding protein n=1 Tax=Caproicibacter fermentans TaxID=2576756 RepID=UPI001E634A70|nr:DNA-binding protein [Caproicibacter fermentans]
MSDFFMGVDEVAKELEVSKSFAYKVMRELNTELKKKGYLTVSGKVAESIFWKSCVTVNPKAKRSDTGGCL